MKKQNKIMTGTIESNKVATTEDV